MTLLAWLQSFDTTIRSGSPLDVDQLLAQCASDLRWSVPADYAALMRDCDGFECYFPNGRCADVWPLTELATRNAETAFEIHAPHLVVIGSTLSNGAIVVDRSTGQFAIVPFDDPRWELADTTGDSLQDILLYLQRQ